MLNTLRRHGFEDHEIQTFRPELRTLIESENVPCLARVQARAHWRAHAIDKAKKRRWREENEALQKHCLIFEGEPARLKLRAMVTALERTAGDNERKIVSLFGNENGWLDESVMVRKMRLLIQYLLRASNDIVDIAFQVLIRLANHEAVAPSTVLEDLRRAGPLFSALYDAVDHDVKAGAFETQIYFRYRRFKRDWVILKRRSDAFRGKEMGSAREILLRECAEWSYDVLERVDQTLREILTMYSEVSPFESLLFTKIKSVHLTIDNGSDRGDVNDEKQQVIGEVSSLSSITPTQMLTFSEDIPDNAHARLLSLPPGPLRPPSPESSAIAEYARSMVPMSISSGDSSKKITACADNVGLTNAPPPSVPEPTARIPRPASVDDDKNATVQKRLLSLSPGAIDFDDDRDTTVQKQKQLLPHPPGVIHVDNDEDDMTQERILSLPSEAISTTRCDVTTDEVVRGDLDTDNTRSSSFSDGHVVSNETVATALANLRRRLREITIGRTSQESATAMKLTVEGMLSRHIKNDSSHEEMHKSTHRRTQAQEKLVVEHEQCIGNLKGEPDEMRMHLPSKDIAPTADSGVHCMSAIAEHQNQRIQTSIHTQLQREVSPRMTSSRINDELDLGDGDDDLMNRVRKLANLARDISSSDEDTLSVDSIDDVHEDTDSVEIEDDDEASYLAPSTKSIKLETRLRRLIDDKKSALQSLARFSRFS